MLDPPPAIVLNGIAKIYRLYDSPTEQALDVFGLSRLRFWRKPRYHEKAALDDISLLVRRGERIGIIGRNGAGKTTLLKLITGNFAPTRGTVVVNGSVQALINTGLGFHPEFTGYENIRASLVYNGLTEGELDAAIADIVDFVELDEYLYQPIKTYSLGMRAPVARRLRAGSGSVDLVAWAFPTEALSLGACALSPMTIPLGIENGRQHSTDARNADFWNTLCGSWAAQAVGVSDDSVESLRRFDEWFFAFYPYLDAHVPFQMLRGRRVLEVGLGYGTVAQRIAGSETDYTGLDIAPGPVEMVNHRMRIHGFSGRAQ